MNLTRVQFNVPKHLNSRPGSHSVGGLQLNFIFSVSPNSSSFKSNHNVYFFTIKVLLINSKRSKQTDKAKNTSSSGEVISPKISKDQ